MKWIYLILAALWAGIADAELPAEVQKLSAVQDILAHNCIRIEADGDAKADFADLLAVNGRTDLLDAVQREYAATLPEGKSPEFVVEETAPGNYFYKNRKDQESRITELMREQLDDGDLHAVMSISGERFFGKFEALVHVQIADEKDGNVSYFVEVYAWPENMFCRFVARGLRFAVESFFDSKTSYMTDLVLDICSRLVDQQVALLK